MSAPDEAPAEGGVLEALIDRAVAPLRAEIAELRARVGSSGGGGARYVSREQAARHYGVSLPTVDRWVRSRLITARKVGRRVLVDLESLRDVDQIVAARRAGLRVAR